MWLGNAVRRKVSAWALLLPFAKAQQTSRNKSPVAPLLSHDKNLLGLPIKPLLEGSAGSSEEKSGFLSLLTQRIPAGNNAELFPTLSTSTRAKGDVPALTLNFPSLEIRDFSAA